MILPLSLRVAFCVSPICLTSREATLWRQAGRILYALDALDRRKPQERRRRFRVDDWRGEHEHIEKTVRALLAAHGADAAVVPKWDSHDFDSIYVVTITSVGDTRKATFALMHQGLDEQKETCPQ